METGTIDDMPSVGVPVPPVYQFGAQNCSATSGAELFWNGSRSMMLNFSYVLAIELTFQSDRTHLECHGTVAQSSNTSKPQYLGFA